MALAKHFALRMDILSPEDVTSISEWLNGVSSNHFVVREHGSDSENPHMHAVLFSAQKIASLRQSFRRKFPQHTGNSSYSLKECNEDVEAYGRYLCKGGDRESMPDVVCRLGMDYTDEWVKAMHDQYWVNNDALVSNRRKRAMNMVERLELECKEKQIRWTDRKAIAMEYVRLQKDARKPLNSFAARAAVNTVSVLLDDSGEAAEQLAIEISGRF